MADSFTLCDYSKEKRRMGSSLYMENKVQQRILSAVKYFYLLVNDYTLYYYAPNFEEVEEAYSFVPACPSARPYVRSASFTQKS